MEHFYIDLVPPDYYRAVAPFQSKIGFSIVAHSLDSTRTVSTCRSIPMFLCSQLGSTKAYSMSRSAKIGYVTVAALANTLA